VRFGVFGLGNKQYEHFNAVGKKMHKNMETLGAAAICRRGDGDDDDSIDDDFEKWCNDLFAALEAEPQLLGSKAEAGAGVETIATYRVELLPGKSRLNVKGQCSCKVEQLTDGSYVLSGC
jgi:NADPH-ferrihemoprotein reductase